MRPGRTRVIDRWRAAMSNVLQVVVTGCEGEHGCPFCYDSTCTHPDTEDRRVNVVPPDDAPCPDWCPLREESVRLDLVLESKS